MDDVTNRQTGTEHVTYVVLVLQLTAICLKLGLSSQKVGSSFWRKNCHSALIMSLIDSSLFKAALVAAPLIM